MLFGTDRKEIKEVLQSADINSNSRGGCCFFSSMVSCVKYGKTELQVDNISRVSNLFACRRQLIFSKKQFKDDEQSLHE